MELTVKIDIKIVENEKENIVNINIIGEDMGILIGKRGQTLDSLQYLVSLVINKECEKLIELNLTQKTTENVEKLHLKILHVISL